MSSVLAVLVPADATSHRAVALRASQAPRCTASALQPPLRGLVEECALRRHALPFHPARLIPFDPARLRGEDGLFFSSNPSNHVQLDGPRVASHQFLLFVHPSSRALSIKNVGGAKRKVVDGAQVSLHTGTSTRSIGPGETAALQHGWTITLRSPETYQFTILIHPGPFDTLLARRIDELVRSSPMVRALAVDPPPPVPSHLL